MAVSLRTLIESRRVILCVGCGGVGKTTTAAALGVAAAVAGKRALCLTIDPARRLAERLALSHARSRAPSGGEPRPIRDDDRGAAHRSRAPARGRRPRPWIAHGDDARH